MGDKLYRHRWPGKEIASLSVYPNPSRANLVYLQLDHFSAGIGHLQLINSEGKIVLAKDLSLSSGSSNQSVDLSRLPKGIYLIRIIAPDHTIINKRIIH
ncbi:MAG: T9SS type A sorting domain-containing protein [Ginsengibacter sp.]